MTSGSRVTLESIPFDDLMMLAESLVPPRLSGTVVDGALPPAFVAIRSLDQIRSGKPAHWCSTFYIRDAGGMIVGGCGFRDAPSDGRVEIGYAISPQRRGLGIATDAIRALVALAFEGNEIERVLAQVEESNLASMRVVEKLGFVAAAAKVDADNGVLIQWVLRRPRIASR